MPTQYPILYNRPIDQWKVAELKEELKRRKLAIRGLKDDLIKRLDEAIRNERDSIEEEAAIHTEKDSNEKEEAICVEKDSAKDEGAICTQTDFSMKEEAVFTEKDSAKDTIENGFDCDQESKVECIDVETKSTEAQMVEDIRVLDENQAQEVDDYAAVVDIDGSPKGLGEGKSQEAELTDTTDSVELVGQPIDLAVSMETNITISETVITQTTSSEQETQNNGAQIENEDPKPLHEDAILDVSDPNNQVSEVNPVLGFQVKSESISADSLSINEKSELKDNLNADNFHLELEVIKPEMVQPSSSDIPSKDDDDIQVRHENQSFIEEIDDTSATYVDLSKKNDSADGESEKINLDRSLVVDSMEEDILESKHDDSNHDSDEVGDRSEVCVVKEESPDDASGLGLSFDKNVIPTESKNTPVVPAEKRKPEEQEVVGNNEPSKRQRRWNSETLKIPELQTSNLTTSTTPKDTIQSATPKRNFTRSESTLSGGDTPKERVVPQSPKPPTNSLRIDRFLRPFTLKAVQELLAKTGTVCSFWMDHIKTHCYVTYSSVEEAIETRNALYNLQWPANGGRLLVAEFVEPQEVKMRAEAPPQSPAAPVSTSPITPPAPSPFQPQPSSRQKTPRQQLPPPPPPLLSDPPEARERLPLPPPPPLHKKPDQPIVTLDDLFKKTKATPRIYYLPLSEEQVAAKLAQKGKNGK